MKIVGSSEAPSSVPISFVAHYAFCPRRAWLEAAGEKLDTSAAMATGESSHRRVHDAAASSASTVRSMEVHSIVWGFHGRLDAAEFNTDGEVVLIEYKATPERRSMDVTPAMVVQLALQTIALEEMGYTVNGAELFFTTHNRRKPIDITDGHRAQALRWVEQTRRTVDGVAPPPPLEDDDRCARCSHVSLCLPDESRGSPTPRRIAVRDPDGEVLHLATYGARASLRSGRVRVQRMGEEIVSVPIERVQAVIVHGNVDLSTGLLRELLWRRVQVLWCSSTGRLVGFAASAARPNGQSRVRQHVASAGGRPDLAREFISAKIANQATLLRRHGTAPELVKRLRDLAKDVSLATTTVEVLGLEGAAAAIYFEGLPTMWVERARSVVEDFPGRVGRGATDRLNICLNYTYGLLLAEVTRALVACGLDPHAGFLHSSGRNKPALALDLMEEFRPLIGDSVVLGAINNVEIRLDGFIDLRGTMRLEDHARKALIAAYERRMTTEFRHPTFRYRLTWRRALEVQARMLLAVINGDRERYVGIRTR